MKPKRKIIEELLIEYINQEHLDQKFQEMGLRINHFKFDKLHEWALDIIGFPEDTTCDRHNDINPYGFCRDDLSVPLFEINQEADIHLAVTNYVDWLYQEYENYRSKNPLPKSGIPN